MTEHKHEHKEECVHCIHYCEICGVEYCCKCKREWCCCGDWEHTGTPTIWD